MTLPSTALSPIALDEPPAETASALVAWSVGPWQCGEFAVLQTVLGALAEWPHVATLADAIELLDGHAAPPEVLLLAQPRPGFYSAVDAAAVARVAPLTRLVVVAGTWCEGELRTGHPLPGTTRLYWYHFEAWWRRGFAARAAGACPPWADPLADSRQSSPGFGQTASSIGAHGVDSVEARLANGAPLAPPADSCVAVDTGDYESFESLRIALRPFGWRCVWQPRHRPEVWDSARATGGLAHPEPVAGIWDGGQLSPLELQQLAQFAERLSGRRAPVIALLDFPRAEHVAATAAAGATAVIGKPYLVDGVAGELAQAVAQSEEAHAAPFTTTIAVPCE